MPTITNSYCPCKWGGKFTAGAIVPREQLVKLLMSYDIRMREEFA